MNEEELRELLRRQHQSDSDECGFTEPSAIVKEICDQVMQRVERFEKLGITRKRIPGKKAKPCNEQEIRECNEIMQRRQREMEDEILAEIMDSSPSWTKTQKEYLEDLLAFSVRKSGATAPVTLNYQRQLDELAKEKPAKVQHYTVGLR